MTVINRIVCFYSSAIGPVAQWLIRASNQCLEGAGLDSQLESCGVFFLSPKPTSGPTYVQLKLFIFYYHLLRLVLLLVQAYNLVYRGSPFPINNICGKKKLNSAEAPSH